MEIKVLLVLFAFIGSSLSQRVSCDYELRTVNGRQQYMCYMSIDNPSGWNNFTQVEGFHFPGMNNVFVTAIIRNTTGSSTTTIPDIICSQFPHVTYIDFSYLDLQEVSENAFRGCRNLDWLRLYNNRISQFPENLFFYNRHLRYLDLERNSLTTLPENIFVNQLALETLDFSNNPIANFPAGVFRNLLNLRSLHLRGGSLTSVNPRWFQSLFNLLDLDLSFNRNLHTVPVETFNNLLQLETLYLARTSLTRFHNYWFENSKHLRHLFMYGNQFDVIPSQIVINSPDLMTIDFGSNNLWDISPNAFANQPNLVLLSLEGNVLTRIRTRWFEDKPNLEAVYFDSNQIAALPVGTFATTHNLRVVGLWNNRIRTINRNSFGSLENLITLDLTGNGVNSVDERFLRELTNLYYFYFTDNTCGNNMFFDFAGNLEENIREFAVCMRNFGFTSERTTEEGSPYTFVPGYSPGMIVEVNRARLASIALTPFEVVWNPMLEIHFSNTTVRIVRNQVTDVAVVPNLGYFTPEAGNRYRITWSRQILLLFLGDEDLPFIAYTMEDWFAPSFLGLRSPRLRGFWFVEPIQIPQGG